MRERFMNSGHKLVVTGAGGFLGQRLVERLKDGGQFRVYALSSRPDALREQTGGRAVEYLHRDFIETDRAPELLRGAALVNCAYPRNSAGTEIADGLRYIQRLYWLAARSGASAIVNISSQSVYSQRRTEAATETTPVCPESPYAVGKYAVELMLESVCRESGTAYTSLRMASLIGPGFDQRIVNRLAMKLLRRESVTIVRQDKEMGFLDVEDAVGAIVAVLACPRERWAPVYNVGNGRGYTAEDVFHAVADVLRTRMEVDDAALEQGSEVSSTAVSFERLHRDTGFVPAVSLHDSVERIVDRLCEGTPGSPTLPERGRRL